MKITLQDIYNNQSVAIYVYVDATVEIDVLIKTSVRQEKKANL